MRTNTAAVWKRLTMNTGNLVAQSSNCGEEIYCDAKRPPGGCNMSRCCGIINTNTFCQFPQSSSVKRVQDGQPLT